MLNYGDAIAHLHIARRVFDCRYLTITQLGSVWLPLPHILMLPFVQSYALWANGLAGTIPSALAYLASCIGLYRLARHWLPPSSAAIALAFFALNPKLFLYLQTTAMTEPLFLCEMIWIVLGVVEWHARLETDAPRAARLEGWIAAMLVAAVFTRYDGWIIALLVWTGMGLAILKHGQLRSRGFWLASVAVVAAPLAWFAYNAIAFGDWLDFARGPYSAMAIEARTAVHGAGPPHPGWHNPWVALLFFLKTAEMDAATRWGNLMLALGVLGTIGAVIAISLKASTQKLRMGAPSLAPRSLLRLLHRLRLRANLPARLVAALLVQHALRHRAVARAGARPWFRRTLPSAYALWEDQAALGKLRRCRALRTGTC